MQQRLVDYSIEIIRVAEKLPKTFAGIHLAKQLIRSGTSPALNYGEAQGAESRRDFIHKLRIALKELRETYVSLKIIQGAFTNYNPDLIKAAIQETDELASIMFQSIRTAQGGS